MPRMTCAQGSSRSGVLVPVCPLVFVDQEIPHKNQSEYMPSVTIGMAQLAGCFRRKQGPFFCILASIFLCMADLTRHLAPRMKMSMEMHGSVVDLTIKGFNNSEVETLMRVI